MPTQINERPINERPTQPGTYPAVQSVQQAAPPWLQRDDDDLDLAQLLQILRRRSLIITGVAITVASVFWAWTLTRTPIYRGSFRVLIESVDENNPSQDLLRDERGALASTVDYDTQIEVLLSAVLLQPISQDLQEKYPNLTADQIAEGLSINRLRETKVLEVSFRGSEPQKIQDILDEVAQQYLEYSFDQRQASLNQGIQFVDDQLPELRERVNNLEVRLERFRQQYSLLDPENRGDDLSNLISQVEEERQQLQTELSQARSLYRSLQSQLSVSPEEALAAAALSESPRYQALLNQIQELEAQLAVESAKYQPDSPQLAVLRERRDNLAPMLEAEAADILGDRFAVGSGGRVDGNLTPTAIDLGRQLINAANNVQMLQARSQTLAQVEQSLKQEFSLVPSLARQYTDLQRELEIATESLNRFLTTRETLQIDAAQKSIPWQLIAEPRTSRIPISPNIPRNLMLGIVSGLVLGGAAALLVEKLDQVYHSPDELKNATHLPLLGIIPFHPNLQEQQNQEQPAHHNGQNGGASRHDRFPPPAPPAKAAPGKRRTTFQSSMFFEAFRSLYTNIRFLGSDAPIRSLVISSAIPSEGKSTISLYLARAAAVMGQRVLLVDADLRSPKHHIFLGLPNIRGVSNLISESLQVRDVVQRSPLDENLSVITAGPVPPDPVKLLSSRRMQSLMEQFQQEYDFVVYDMPPILGFADSSIVAAHTDGMIMVAGLGKTERSAISRALDEVKLSPVNILGVIANGIKSYTTRVYGYHRYYRYYPKHDETQGSQMGGTPPLIGATDPSVPSVPPMPPGAPPSHSTSPSSPISSSPNHSSDEPASIGVQNPFDFSFDQSLDESSHEASHESPDASVTDDATSVPPSVTASNTTSDRQTHYRVETRYQMFDARPVDDVSDEDVDHEALGNPVVDHSIPDNSIADNGTSVHEGLSNEMSDYESDYEREREHTPVQGASIHGASISGASISGASISGASISGASISGASISGISADEESVSQELISEESISEESVSEESVSEESTIEESISEESVDIYKDDQSEQFSPVQDAAVDDRSMSDMSDVFVEDSFAQTVSDDDSNDAADDYLIYDVPFDGTFDDTPFEDSLSDASSYDTSEDTFNETDSDTSVQGWQYDVVAAPPATDSPSSDHPFSDRPSSDHPSWDDSSVFDNSSSDNSSSGNSSSGNSSSDNSSSETDDLEEKTAHHPSSPHVSLSTSGLHGKSPSPLPSKIDPSLPDPTPVTVNSDGLPGVAKVLIGVSATAALGVVGWSVYQHFTEAPSPSPDGTIETPTPPSQNGTPGDDPSPSPGNLNQDLNPVQPTEPQPTEPQPTEPQLIEPQPEFSGDPVPEPEASEADPTATPETIPEDATPELAPEVQDPFAEAVRLAQEAVDAGETANTPEEWSRIAEQWQRASALMAIVPQSDERFSIARDRTVLYRNNGEFARQKVLELLSTKDF